MFDFEVFDVSVLHDLHMQNWTDQGAFASILSASLASITNDGHLVLKSPLVPQTLRESAIETICRSEESQLLLSGGFVLTVFYRDKIYKGNLRHLERMSCTDYRDPEVFGNFADQYPGFATITVVSNRQTVNALLERWKAYSSSTGHRRKSALHIAASHTAIQASLCCEEVSFEDVVDVVVAGSFAIKEQRNGKMIHGLSYSQASGVPIKWIQVSVADEYGPFERI